MNVSMSELVVIVLVALLVIKPEQLPELAHLLGRFTSKVRAIFSKLKTEMNGLVDKEASEKRYHEQS